MADFMDIIKQQEAQKAAQKQAQEDELRRRVEAQSALNQVSTAPLAALVEGIYGGNELQRVAQGMDAKAAKEQDAIDSIREAVGGTGGANEDKLDLGLARLLATKEAQDETTSRFKQQKKYQLGKDFRKDAGKLNTDMSRIQQGFDNVEAGYSPGKDGMVDIKKVLTSLSVYARSIGGEKGTLAEGDIQRALWRDLKIQLEELKATFGAEGKIPAEKLAIYYQRIKEARNAALTSYNDEIDSLEVIYGTDEFGQDMLAQPGAQKTLSNLRSRAGGLGRKRSAPAPIGGDVLKQKTKIKKGKSDGDTIRNKYLRKE